MTFVMYTAPESHQRRTMLIRVGRDEYVADIVETLLTCVITPL